MVGILQTATRDAPLQSGETRTAGSGASAGELFEVQGRHSRVEFIQERLSACTARLQENGDGVPLSLEFVTALCLCLGVSDLA